MVGYTVAADGQLHVVGLQSGKDLQKPAPFLPPNSQWSNPVAVGTMMYAATSGNCAGAPNGVYAIDLDAPDKPVVSYRTNGGSVVGAVAFSSDGNTLLAAIGPGSVTGNGKANAIVALDPKTLQLKDWFTQPTAEFVTGPTVFRHGTKDLVSAATKDGRVILLDAASLGGANHATPLVASPPLFASGGAISAEALSTWARAAAATTAPADSAARWILVPVSGRPVGDSHDERRDPERRGRRASSEGRQRHVLARARVDVQRSDIASDANHCQWSRVRAVQRPAGCGRPDRIASGALRPRWSFGQGALEQRKVDDGLCVPRQLLERVEPGVRRRRRRDGLRVRIPRRTAVSVEALMRLLIAILASATLLSAQTTPYAPKQSDRPEVLTGDEPGFQPIFDGKTLAGWEGNTTYWRVENGVLVGEITPATVIKSNTFIIWRGGSPADFELKLDYRITEAGNSGINYRSVVVPDPVTPDNKFAMSGYQFDLDGRKRYDGNNYEEKGRLFLAVRGQMSHVVGGRPPVVLSSFATSDELARVSDRRLERGAPHRARQHGDAHPQRPPHEHHDRRRCAEPQAGWVDRHAGAHRPADEDRVSEYSIEALVAAAYGMMVNDVSREAGFAPPPSARASTRRT